MKIRIKGLFVTLLVSAVMLTPSQAFAEWPVVITTPANSGYVQINDPVVVDLDGDNHLDVLVTYNFSPTQSYVDAYNHEGIQKTELGFPIFIQGNISGPASVGDLDGDGSVDFVVNTNVKTYLFKRVNGVFVEAWHFDIGSYAPPVLGDIDHNGNLEIVFTTSHNVYALHHDGTLVSGWPSITGGFQGTPALADIDQNDNGKLEIITHANNVLYAFNDNGSLVSGNWPVVLPPFILDGSPTTNSFMGSAQIGNLDNDTAGTLEIVHGTTSGKVLIIDNQGNILQQLGGNDLLFSYNSALGDIDGDGDLEIFSNVRQRHNPFHQLIYAWHHDGTPVAGSWPANVGNVTQYEASVVLGDIDGDGNSDVLFQSRLPVQRPSGSWVWRPYISAFHTNGDVLGNGEWPHALPYDPVWEGPNVSWAPVLTDLDGDSNTDIVSTSYTQTPGGISDTLYINVLHLSASYNPATLHWPMYQHDAQRTGKYSQPSNHPPVLNPIGNRTAQIRRLLTFTVSATDPDPNTTLHLSASGLPQGATFVDHGDGTGTFSWRPGFNQAGFYNVLFTVSDGDLTDTEPVMITVNGLQVIQAIPLPEP